MTKSQLLNGGRTLGLLMAAMASVHHSKTTDAHACITCNWNQGGGYCYATCVIGGVYTDCETETGCVCNVYGWSSECAGF
jgi:hypothetical protein